MFLSTDNKKDVKSFVATAKKFDLELSIVNAVNLSNQKRPLKIASKISKYYNDDLKAANFKFSYYKRSNIYWELDRQRGKETNKYAWQDDYPNQTYWMTFDINYFTENCCWPGGCKLAGVKVY